RGERNSKALLPDTGCPPGMDGQRSGPEAVARVSRQTVPGNRHKVRQIESIRSRARFARHPRGGRGAVAVLGHNWPGSEGNLASNIEDTASTVGDTPPQEKPTEKAAEKQPAPAETTEKSAGAPPPAEKPHGERAERAERSQAKTAAAAAAAAPPPPPAAEAKPVEAPAAAPPEPTPLTQSGPGHQRRKALQGVKNGTPTLDLVELK